MQQHKSLRILIIESYYGGSHRAFIQGMEDHLDHDFFKLTLPPRKWKMRMQLAAPWMADKTIALIRGGRSFDCILCSSLLDVATFRTLLYKAGVVLPVGIYFHENQFVYPNQINDPQSYQFSALNFTSALAADGLAFNSMYNRDTFLAGVGQYLKKAADMDILYRVETLRRKSVVLYPGMDYTQMDRAGKAVRRGVPVLLWNHRWEHDKDPETFFHGLYDLAHDGIDFRLIVLGQSFERCPAIFDHARERLGAEKYIDHFGFAGEREEYINLLCRGSIAVSTARHEFFGIAVLEAVRCGCRPLVPDRLSYKELFPDQYRYPEGTFPQALKTAVTHFEQPDDTEISDLTDIYAWSRMTGAYNNWFTRLSDTEKNNSAVGQNSAEKR